MVPKRHSGQPQQVTSASNSSRVPTGLYARTRLSRILWPFWPTFSKLESFFVADEIAEREISRPVYVTGIARAGTTTEYPFGDEISYLQAHFSDTRKQEQPVEVDGALVITNRLGLKHVIGNVSEWVEDAWFDSFAGAASDQRARTGAADAARVVRGGSFIDRAPDLRSAARTALAPDSRVPHTGFRVARDMHKN